MKKETSTGLLVVFVLMTVGLLAVQEATASVPTAQIRFQEVAATAGIEHEGLSWGSSWGDLNGDGWPDLWVGNHPTPPSLYVNQGDGTFANLGDVAGLQAADLHGASWADYDNDGDQDLVALVGAEGGTGDSPNFLLVNDDGVLVDRAVNLGVDYALGRGRTPLWLDVDGDGTLELVFSNEARTDGQAPTALFRQTATGFQDISATAGFTITQHAHFAQLVDLSGDGRLDLAVHGWSYPQQVYGIGTIPLVLMTTGIGLPKTTTVQDVALGDLDGNLRADILAIRSAGHSDALQIGERELGIDLLAVQAEHGVSFQTTGDVTFDLYGSWRYLDPNRVFVGAGGAHPPDQRFTLSPADPTVTGIYTHTPGIDDGIYVGYDPATQTWQLSLSNSDAWANKIQGRILTASPIVQMTPIGFEPDETPPVDRLLFQGANGFSDWTVTAGLTMPTECHSAVAGDLDNDMDLDLYLVCTRPVANLPNRLYENQGDGTFAVVPDAGGAAGSAIGRGDSVSIADYDQDGFLDLFVTNGLGSYPFNDGPDQLFRNLGNGNHWLEIDLVGTVSNRDGIGATVLATAGGVTQLREQGGGMHDKSQNHQRLHFGLGSNTQVDTLTVRWPSGLGQTLHDIPADQLIRIHEHNAVYLPVVMFNSATYTVDEGTGEAVITVSLSGTNALTITVGYDVYDGTATNGDDYTATHGTLTFAPGTATQTFTVSIVNDDQHEDDETVYLTLSDPVNARTASPNPATLTISDDDPVPTATVMPRSDTSRYDAVGGEESTAIAVGIGALVALGAVGVLAFWVQKRR